MDHATLLEDMMISESPVEWAFDNLSHIDSGTAAAVFSHPADGSLAIRVSEYPDGWFRYALECAVDHDGDAPSPYTPRVHWLSHKDGVFVGVTERLETIDEEGVMGDMVRKVIRAFRAGESWSEIDDVMPGFSSFAARLDTRLDLRPSNFLHRDGCLVFNDPYSAIPHAMLEAISGRLAYEPPASDVRPPLRPFLP